MMRITRCSAVLAACAMWAIPAWAAYRGTVQSSGQPLPGATVTATQGTRKLVTTTDDRGLFSFDEVSDGAWTIAIEMPGFVPVSKEIAASEPAVLWDLAIVGKKAAAARPPQAARPGFQRVNGNQMSGTTLSTEGTLKSEEIADLTPSSANSFIVQGSMSSAAGMPPRNDWGFGPPGMGGVPGLMPGAPGEGPGGASMPGGGQMQAGGQAGPRGGGGGMMGGGPGGPGGGGGMMGGPGGPGGGPPPGGPGGPGGPGMGPRPDWQRRPDAMAFGNRRRDPRRMYMGMANFSLDNSVWDARTFSVTGADVAKPAYASGRASLMFGGPLQIPKLISANKQIMFMFNYEVQRSRTGNTSDPVNMPTAAERIGDFSASPYTIYDPLTGTPFAGNKIPTSRIAAASTALLQYYPNANIASATRNYQTSWTGVNNSQNLNARVMNIGIGSKERLSGGIGYQGSNSVTPNLFQFTDTGSGSGINASLGWSHTINAKLINSLNYNFSRNRQQSLPYFANTTNVATALGIAGTSQNPLNWGPPSLSFTNYAGLNDGSASLMRNQTSGVSDSLLWVRGSHNFTFGGDFRRQQFNQFADSNGRGTYSFNGSATSYYVNGVAQANTGYDLADFLLGLPTTASIRYGNADKYFRGSTSSLFVNDEWRVTAKFSLVVGLRWEYATPVDELYGRLVNLQVSSDFSTITAVKPNLKPDRNNFAPRVGFAWRPGTKDSLVVRGGYGIYYNTSVYNIISGNMAQQPPYAQVLNATSSAANPLNIATGFLQASASSLSSTYAIDPNYRIGHAQTWTLTVQHDLPFSMFATAGYLGTKGTRLDQQFIPNSVAPGAVESSLPHGYIYETSNGNSTYHAAQFQLNRRFRTGVGVRSSYQFSKSIDNAGTGGRGQGNTPVAQDWTNLSAERGLSSFDARHNLSLEMQYSTGMGRSGGTLLTGWKGGLIKDWTISGTISARSGNPLTATAGGNRSQVGGTAVTNTVRANATGLAIGSDSGSFNTAAFTTPAAGEWGTAGRNTIPGPTTFYLNGSLSRVFRLGERRSADLQLQAQNLLNHVTITGWNTVVGSTNYGLATSAAGMRRLTASLRFRF